MTGHDFVPAGRAIVPVAPRHGALAAITERVRERRRRRRRNTALAGLAAAVAVAAPLLLHGDPFTTGLEPAKPGVIPSATTSHAAIDVRAPGGPSGYGPAVPPGAVAATAAAVSQTPRPDATPSTDAPAEPAGTLTITGVKSGYGLVRVDRPTTVDLTGFAFSSFGEYTGVAIGGVEVLSVRGMDDAGAPAYRGATSVTLPAGVHRMYLFTPAGVTAKVTLPWSARSLVVWAAMPVQVHYLAPAEMVARDGSGRGDGFGQTAVSTVGIVAAAFDPAPAGVSLVGCFTTDPVDKTCVHGVTAMSDGTKVRLNDRLSGIFGASNSYTVTVHKGDNAESPGVLRYLIFSYDRD